MHYPAPHTGYRHSAGLGQGNPLTQALASVGRASVRGAVFRSTVSPEVVIADPLRPSARTVSEGGLDETFLRLIKPAVYLDTAAGPMKIAPWGEPRANYFPLVAGVALLGSALLIGMIVRGFTR